MFRPALTAVMALTGIAALASCSRSDEPPAPRPALVSATAAVATHAAPPAAELLTASTTQSPWPPAAMQDPDPRLRRFALDVWAREPTESLDLVSAALVDPEESIRDRAAQVFEDVLAREQRPGPRSAGQR